MPRLVGVAFGGREPTGVTDITTDQKPLKPGFDAETTAEVIVSGIDLGGKVCV
jgi:hypothetical protein